MMDVRTVLIPQTSIVLPLGLSCKQYRFKIMKFMLLTLISSGHFYSVWINLTACHTAEIKHSQSVHVANKSASSVCLYVKD